MHSFASLRCLVLAATCLALGACSSADAAEESATTEGAIAGGTATTDYPEVVIIRAKGDMNGRWAVGTLIAPRVVLTADFVLDQYTDWEVTAPNAGQQKAKAFNRAWFDTSSLAACATGCQFMKAMFSGYRPEQLHSVGLLFLDTSITLSADAYAEVATAPLAAGAPIVRVGLRGSGAGDRSSVFVSQPDAIEDGGTHGLPWDYTAAKKLEYGDGGGPVFADCGAGCAGRRHKVVAVNWGFGNGNSFWHDYAMQTPPAEYRYDYLARVDVVATWIAEQIKKNIALP